MATQPGLTPAASSGSSGVEPGGPGASQASGPFGSAIAPQARLVGEEGGLFGGLLAGDGGGDLLVL